MWTLNPLVPPTKSSGQKNMYAKNEHFTSEAKEEND